MQYIPLYVLYTHTHIHFYLLPHTHLLTHIAAIQAHSELFLLDARKEKCIQARVSFPFPRFLSLSLYFFAFSFFFYWSLSRLLARSLTLLVLLLLSCRCRTWLSLAALTILQPYNIHSRRSVIQSVIYSYTHSPTHDWHSLSHPHSLTLACSFIHCNGVARCFVGRSFWVQLTNVCSWTLSINIHTQPNTHTHTLEYGRKCVIELSAAKTQAKMKNLSRKGKILDMTKHNAGAKWKEGTTIIRAVHEHMHTYMLFVCVCICLCNSKYC